ncbi:MAG TPA: hypothetical protein VM389_05470 [Phycisphaerae bacterium]|nr:hypothetical protein [Phycisphaerae bacterium]
MGDEKKKVERIRMKVALPKAGVPDAHGTVYSEEAIKQMAEQAERGVPVLDRTEIPAGVQIGGTVGATKDEDGVRVLTDIQLDYIAVIPKEQLVDKNCVFLPAQEHEMPKSKGVFDNPPLEGEDEEQAE